MTRLFATALLLGAAASHAQQIYGQPGMQDRRQPIQSLPVGPPIQIGLGGQQLPPYPLQGQPIQGGQGQQQLGRPIPPIQFPQGPVGPQMPPSPSKGGGMNPVQYPSGMNPGQFPQLPRQFPQLPSQFPQGQGFRPF